MGLILGLDVSKDFVVSCLIDEGKLLGLDTRELYHTQDFLHLPADANGMRQLLTLKPDVAVLEPTGTNYSKVWIFQLGLAGVPVFLVGHKQLKVFRQNLGLPNKDDRADALALALYYHEFGDRQRRFLTRRPPNIYQLRDCVCRLNHLNRLKTPVINRLRQDLAWQFPEAQNKSLDSTLFWPWLAGQKASSKYDLLLAESVGVNFGQLLPVTRMEAGILQQMLQMENLLQNQLESLLDHKLFEPYHQAMRDFYFGPRVTGAILSTIYPVDQFFDASGIPENQIIRGSRRRFSQNRFVKALGVAPRQEESGSSTKKTFKDGSALCRKALWLWVFTHIEVANKRPQTPVCQQLGDLLDAKKASHQPAQLIRSLISAKAAKMLFNTLVQVLKPVK